MRFGINFFPSVDPAHLSGHEYYRQALALAARADELGYHHIRTVEHFLDFVRIAHAVPFVLMRSSWIEPCFQGSSSAA